MLKRIASAVLTAAMLLVMLCAVGAMPAAAAGRTQADAATNFAFGNGTMSKEVLRSYASRAVTHQNFTAGVGENLVFEEDLRMLLRIGAKYIGRAAMISWNGNLTAAQVENHFAIAEEYAAKVHEADSQIILQAGIFEIAYKGTVNSVKIPAYVFEAFGQPVEDRCFRWEDVVYPRGAVTITGKDIGIGCWGKDDSGTPDIKQLETKMYFYYMITRYIDAGYEAFHMGQAELMMQYDAQYSTHWQTLLDKARTYARRHARRGVALFDCHTALDSAGIKVGNKLVFDIQGAGMCPNETDYEDGAYKAELLHYKELVPDREDGLSWVGRSAGGEHPLGFEIETNFTIVEFDNYGGNGKPGVATYKQFYNWGHDDVTWFATQPEWYRNEFLLTTATYLANNENCLDSDGKQQYFLQPVTRREITPADGWEPVLSYTPTAQANEDFIFDLCDDENADAKVGSNGVFTITVNRVYRANRNGDGCPVGFGQEDTIREIFRGKNAAEDPTLQQVVLPSEYETNYVTPPAEDTPPTSAVTPPTSESAPPTSESTPPTSDTTPPTSDTTPPPSDGPSTGGDTTVSDTVDDGTSDTDTLTPPDTAPPTTSDVPEEEPTQEDPVATTPFGSGGKILLIVLVCVAALSMAGAGIFMWYVMRRTKQSKQE